ncbi:hypothetical protein HRJ34_21195 [Rhizorhabdus wittichii]|uniref:Uncharacterized protein n=1 Tax=Rhizorhabdus wittichii TaxID=160791 RepID=A0A975D189_9SPHN|nr:hypothetical protein [Rhizorhabdus wittichii]QTH20813.1 hypothetical protein HRJ34_21195 [Rhizorhabdus wittichii]
MIKHLSLLEIINILRAGGGATVSARQFTALDLVNMARSLRGAAVLNVANSQALTGLDMISIARGATKPAFVTFSGRAE